MSPAADIARRDTRHRLVLGALLCIVAVAAATPSGAQQSARGLVFARFSRPMRSVSIGLATGTVSRGAEVEEREGTTVSDFRNLDLGGFIGVDTGAGACHR